MTANSPTALSPPTEGFVWMLDLLAPQIFRVPSLLMAQPGQDVQSNTMSCNLSSCLTGSCVSAS